MKVAEVGASLNVEACSRIVEAVSKGCTPPSNQLAAPPASEPNWDALANSFAGLSAAFAWGSVLLALVAIISAIGWGYVVSIRSEREARKEAQNCAKDLVERWLAEEAPGIIRQHVENLGNASLGAADDAEAADEIGEVAG